MRGRERIVLIVIAISCGVIGFSVSWFSWHLYLDHLFVDAVRTNMLQRQMQPSPVVPTK